MKKTDKITIIKIFVALLFFCLFLFNTSCGLDVIEYYYPPKSVVHISDINAENYNTSIDTSNFYISFYTNEGENTSSTFKGTEIYYQIYNNISDAMSDKNYILTLDTNTNVLSNKSAQKMIDRGYKPLRKLDLSGNLAYEDCLIPKTGSDRNIELRPGYDGNSSVLKINGTTFTPIRWVSDRDGYLSFDFAKYGDRSISSDNTDTYSDVKLNSTTSIANTWYVVFFAVGKGMDYTFTEQYSSVLYLGCLPIYDQSN